MAQIANTEGSVWTGRAQPACSAGALRVIVGILAALAYASTLGAGPKPTEYEIKAAYLYNFGKFVKWPPSGSPADTFPICVLGQDPFGDILDTTLRGESIDGKSLIARRVGSVQEASTCRILFISAPGEKRIKEILAALKKSPVLTVSDMPGFLSAGGMIEFVLEGGRIRFQVNLAAAQNADLSMSSELLKVATAVKTGSAGGG